MEETLHEEAAELLDHQLETCDTLAGFQARNQNSCIAGKGGKEGLKVKKSRERKKERKKTETETETETETDRQTDRQTDRDREKRENSVLLAGIDAALDVYIRVRNRRGTLANFEEDLCE
jgi:hypothetical protein